MVFFDNINNIFR